jgi:hypothetical protein
MHSNHYKRGEHLIQRKRRDSEKGGVELPENGSILLRSRCVGGKEGTKVW